MGFDQFLLEVARNLNVSESTFFLEFTRYAFYSRNRLQKCVSKPIVVALSRFPLFVIIYKVCYSTLCCVLFDLTVNVFQWKIQMDQIFILYTPDAQLRLFFEGDVIILCLNTQNTPSLATPLVRIHSKLIFHATVQLRTSSFHMVQW